MAFIKHPVHAKWHAQSHHIKAMLGLKPGQKLPPEGMEPRHIQGIEVWVVPLSDFAKRSGSRYHARRMGHRVRALCPDCGMEMSAGRLHQHACRKG